MIAVRGGPTEGVQSTRSQTEMPQATFTADEIKVLRFLEKQYLAIGGEPSHMTAPVTRPKEIVAASGLDESTVSRIMARLEALGIAKIIAPGASNSWVKISSSVVNLVHQFDNQPPRDYWSDLKTWAFSKWWIVPVMLIGVGVPWMTGIVLGLRLLLEWFDIPK